MKNKIFLKLLLCPLKGESRSNREIEIAKFFFKKIVVIEKGISSDRSNWNGIEVHTRAMELKGGILRRLIPFLQLSTYLRKVPADCISAYDISALTIAWMSSCLNFGSKKPRLIYDSHEFEAGRSTRRSRFVTNIVLLVEKFLMKRCAFSIMVNDSIADEVQRIHKLKDRPVVVRNMSSYWHIDEAVCLSQRAVFCRTLQVSEDTFVAMYHGMIAENRGVENLIMAVEKSEGAIGVILGYGEYEYIQHLKDLAVSHNVADRILFHPAVPIDELWKYVGAADVAVIVMPIVFKSYYYALPNKLFENIQSMTPIICNNTPEMANIIRKYDIGLTVDPPGDLAGLIAAMKTMRTNKALYENFKHNLIQAKKDLCWENEREILKKAYEKILA